MTLKKKGEIVIEGDYQMVKLSKCVYDRVKYFCDTNDLKIKDWCDTSLLRSMELNTINYGEKILLELDSCVPLYHVDKRNLKEWKLDINKTVAKNNGMVIFMVSCDNADELIKYCESNGNKTYNLPITENFLNKEKPIIKYISSKNILDKSYRTSQYIINDEVVLNKHAIFAIMNAHVFKCDDLKVLLESLLSVNSSDISLLCGLQNPRVEYFPMNTNEYKPIFKSYGVHLTPTDHAYLRVKDTIVKTINNTIESDITDHLLFNIDLSNLGECENNIAKASLYLNGKSNGKPTHIIMSPVTYQKITNTKLSYRINIFEKTEYKIFGYDVILSDYVDGIVLYRNSDDFLSIYYSTHNCRTSDLLLYVNVPNTFNKSIIKLEVFNLTEISFVNKKLTNMIEYLSSDKWFKYNWRYTTLNLNKFDISIDNCEKDILNSIYELATSKTNTKKNIIITNLNGLNKYNIVYDSFINNDFIIRKIGVCDGSMIYLDTSLPNDVSIQYTLSNIEFFYNKNIIKGQFNGKYITYYKINSDIMKLI